MGVEFWPFPILWLLAFTTACTTVIVVGECLFTCSVDWQVRLSVSSMTSSRWPRDNSWYGNVVGGELKSPQMMTAQSPADWALLLLLLHDDDDDDDDVARANCSSSLTANDTWRYTIHIQLKTIVQHRHMAIADHCLSNALLPVADLGGKVCCVRINPSLESPSV